MLRANATQEVAQALQSGMPLEEAISQACRNHPYRPIRAKIPPNRYDLASPVRLRFGDKVDFCNSRLYPATTGIVIYSYKGKIFSLLRKLFRLNGGFQYVAIINGQTAIEIYLDEKPGIES